MDVVPVSTNEGLTTMMTDEISTKFTPVKTQGSGWLWSVQWSWTNSIQLVFAVVGIVGNLLVILALLRRKALRHSTDIFIGALALADFLTSVVMIPVPRAQKVPDTIAGALYCKVVYPSYLMWVLIFSSAYILAGMSVERFVAVVYPLHFNRLFTNTRVYGYLFIVLVCAIPAAGITMTLQVIDDECRDTKTAQLRVDLSIYLFTFRVAVPVLVMVITQVITTISLHRQSKQLHGARSTSKADAPSFHLTARNRIVKMTMIVVIIFVLSLGPNQLMTMIAAVRGTLATFLFSPLYYTLTFLAFVNSCANPFIYAARFPKFRKAVKDIFTSGFSRKNLPLFANGEQPSTMMTSEKDTSLSTVSQAV
ncbi:galanin receptor type 2-like [Diadema setosum]|uniref:galanin receptor type 2-like n=1 Tax=Diadema setosum TaxID=31175 RepID=UPI003B3BD92B